jgi:tetratricopeptide (TPR) repeat protein
MSLTVGSKRDYNELMCLESLCDLAESPTNSDNERVAKAAKTVSWKENLCDVQTISPNRNNLQAKASMCVARIIETADEEMEAGNLEKALRTYRTALKTISYYYRPCQVQKAEVLLGIGVAQFDLKLFPESLESFEAADAVEHGNADLTDRICVNLGVLHQKLGNYLQAKEAFLKALAVEQTPDPRLLRQIEIVSAKIDAQAPPIAL